ncbi:hypothetical protein PENSPDRAFT_666303 [Peniophora sp. CONT]|nr:hypothetical protein PENSPDRAFT_666303 [Peniophora sp. CONT]
MSSYAHLPPFEEIISSHCGSSKPSFAALALDKSPIHISRTVVPQLSNESSYPVHLLAAWYTRVPYALWHLLSSSSQIMAVAVNSSLCEGHQQFLVSRAHVRVHLGHTPISSTWRQVAKLARTQPIYNENKPPPHPRRHPGVGVSMRGCGLARRRALDVDAWNEVALAFAFVSAMISSGDTASPTGGPATSSVASGGSTMADSGSIITEHSPHAHEHVLNNRWEWLEGIENEGDEAICEHMR